MAPDPPTAQPAVRAVRIGHVARGLLEISHEPAPLEHLGEDVGGALAGQVHAAQLGDRVVAVLAEDALVELVGAGGADGRRPGGLPGLLEELVEEEAAQRLGRAGVAGEERRSEERRVGKECRL